MILWLNHNSSFPKFGILVSFYSEIPKVRKSTPSDFNSNVNISGSTTVKASKFCMMLKLDYNNSLPEFRIFSSFHSEALKFRMVTIKVQDNADIKELCSKNGSEMVIAPQNLTNKSQPFDVKINQKAKKFFSHKFNRCHLEVWTDIVPVIS